METSFLINSGPTGQSHGIQLLLKVLLLLRWAIPWSFKTKILIFVVSHDDLMDYFIVCFQHRCCTMRVFKKKHLHVVVDGIWVVLLRFFISTLFATLLRNHEKYIVKNYVTVWTNVCHCNYAN